MKKVVYSIRKVRNSNEKLSGLGFINDEGTLFCKCVSKNGKQYTRAFDDVDSIVNILKFGCRQKCEKPAICRFIGRKSVSRRFFCFSGDGKAPKI